MRRLIALLLLLLAASASPVMAGVEDRVNKLYQAGEIMQFETIRSRVAAQTKGDYIGVEFDESTLTYRFRFLVSGEVINVDVDARTGQRLKRSRNF